MFSVTSTERKNAVIAPAVQVTTKNDLAGEFINGSAYAGGRSIGIFGLTGFEFFLRKEVSLSGEYRLGYTSTKPKDMQVINGATTTTTRGGGSSSLAIGSQGLLTLAVYF
jgi:hypothetical protein